jgi:threonine synthase
MYIKDAQCINCGCLYDITISSYLYMCKNCGGILDIRYDYTKLQKSGFIHKVFQRKGIGVWKYRELLPITDYSKVISMQEGGTRLQKCKAMGKRLSIEHLYIKDETGNPTGSFKDRPTTVTISKANELGIETLIAQSTGNAGASLSAYGAKAGIEVIILVPEQVYLGKLVQMSTYGAQIIAVKGSCSDASRIGKLVAQIYPEMVNLDLTFSNPYSVEGNKTIAYEILEQLHWEVPNWVITPVGSGNLIVGIFKGFQECQKMGLIDNIPSIVAVQAEGCSPIVKAFERNTKVESWTQPCETIASGINDPLIGYTQFGDFVLKAVIESKGLAVKVTDEEIVEAIKLLGTTEGLFAEPAGSSSIAGLMKLINSRGIKKEESIVCIMSGSGFKELETLKDRLTIKTPSLVQNVSELQKILER